MKKNNYLVCVFMLLGTIVFGQVGINNTNPQATFDITAKTTDGSKPEGMIVPRLTGDQIKGGDTQYSVSQKGILVYALSAVTAASAKTVNITTEGYYYFDGNIWQKLRNLSDADDWKRLGNSGTTAGTVDFIGTTDNQDFVTKTNNSEAMRVTNSGKVLVGTATVPTGGSTAKVIINNGTTNGAIQIKDGTEGANKMLVSDANGVGKWTPVLIPAFWAGPIDASTPTASEITIGSLSFRVNLTNPNEVTDGNYIQVRNNTGSNYVGVCSNAIITRQGTNGTSSIRNVIALNTSPSVWVSLPYSFNANDDGALSFNFFSYNDYGFYRVTISVADGDSLGFGGQAFILVEYFKK